MSETKLCEACRALFRSEQREVGNNGWFEHHNNAHDFRVALELGCYVYKLHQSAMARGYGIEVDKLAIREGRTTYSVRQHPKTQLIHFRHNEHY